MPTKIGKFAGFAKKGFGRREVFDHYVIVIPKSYPDSQLLLERRGMSRKLLESGRFFQLNLYTTEIYDLPDELFLDPEVNWHGQQLGKKGLIAAAGLWIKDSTLIVTTLQSDLCQQLNRHARLKKLCKTQVETHFKYWYAILANAIMDFCLDYGLTVIYSPTGRQIVANTQKRIDPKLFLRIYDYPEREYSCRKTNRYGAEYWEIPVQDNVARVARLSRADTYITQKKDAKLAICIFHDIEEDVDTAISPAECARNLTCMLEIEKAHSIDATYDILGTLFNHKRQEIRSFNPRHSIAFHSFNHNLDNVTQLRRCRELDQRVRGYRPPKSKITSELSDYNLTLLNFEWFACASDSLGHTDCRLRNGLIRIPIHVDDYALFKGLKTYEQWEFELLEVARTNSVFGIGLHDCYAGLWLKHYPSLLEKLSAIGAFVSADELCDSTFLRELGSVEATLQPSQVSGQHIFGRVARWLTS
jgi:hypothetical protein